MYLPLPLLGRTGAVYLAGKMRRFPTRLAACLLVVALACDAWAARPRRANAVKRAPT